MINITNYDGTTIKLDTTSNDFTYGEIDFAETDKFKHKKWRTWCNFGMNAYSCKLLEEHSIEEALGTYFFAFLEDPIIEDVKVLGDKMSINVLLFLDKLELPYPKILPLDSTGYIDKYERKQKDNFYVISSMNGKKMTNKEFFLYYRNCIYNAYSKTDYRILYDPFVSTGRFELPFEGRTPAILQIRSV